MKSKRVVVCAANAYKDFIVLGARHFDQLMKCQIMQSEKLSMVKGSAWEQGFVDQFGTFMTRKEALAVAIEAGQINKNRPKTKPEDILFSEDIY